MPAPAPARASASMTLSWGMVAIPVQMFSGTEDTGFKRSRFIRNADGTFSKVRNKMVNEDTGDEIQFTDVISAVETADGVVEVSNEEVEQIVGLVNGTAQIICFIKQQVLFAGGYVLGELKQVRPAKRKSGKQSVYDPAATQSFALLMAAMRRTGSFAVVKVVTRGKPQFMALLPNGDMYSLLFDEQVRERLPMPEIEVEREMVRMGVELVEVGLRDDPPTLSDDATKRLIEYAEKKAKGEAVPLAAKPADEDNGQDLMAALSAAVKQAKDDS